MKSSFCTLAAIVIGAVFGWAAASGEINVVWATTTSDDPPAASTDRTPAASDEAKRDADFSGAEIAALAAKQKGCRQCPKGGQAAEHPHYLGR